jgi:hypothetical protein
VATKTRDHDSCVKQLLELARVVENSKTVLERFESCEDLSLVGQDHDLPGIPFGDGMPQWTLLALEKAGTYPFGR